MSLITKGMERKYKNYKWVDSTREEVTGRDKGERKVIMKVGRQLAFSLNG